MMAPQLATAAQRLAGKALVVKVNTEDNPDLAQRFRVQSIPTLAIFHDGREATVTDVDALLGYDPPAASAGATAAEDDPIKVFLLLTGDLIASLRRQQRSRDQSI